MQACQINLYLDIPLGQDMTILLCFSILFFLLRFLTAASFGLFFKLLSDDAKRTQRPHWAGVTDWVPQRSCSSESSPQGSSMRSGLRWGGPSPSSFPWFWDCPSVCEMTNRASAGLRRPPPPQTWALPPSLHVAFHSQVCFFALESSACRILLCPFHLWSMLYLRGAIKAKDTLLAQMAIF